MEDSEVEKVLEELYQVRPEKLNDKAKRLYEAIMTIADKKDKAEADLYEANKRIDDLLDIEKQKDKIIEDMAEHLTTSIHSKEWVIEYFEERCK